VPILLQKSQVAWLQFSCCKKIRPPTADRYGSSTPLLMQADQFQTRSIAIRRRLTASISLVCG
jgi:hypothetical protein